MATCTPTEHAGDHVGAGTSSVEAGIQALRESARAEAGAAAIAQAEADDAERERMMFEDEYGGGGYDFQEGYEDVDEDEDVFDWETMGTAGAGSGGDFTKRYNAVVTGGMRNPTAVGAGGLAGTVVQAPSNPIAAVSGSDNTATLDQHFAKRVFLGSIRDLKSLSGGVGVSHSGGQSALNSERRADQTVRTDTDRANRATTEQVLDPRTRMILYKLLQRSWLANIHGCVSTGKEANVYYGVAGENAPTGEGGQLAIKIFKTSILVFKDRDRYVTGEYRFRRGYNRHNPRKMVQMWAEKELRNLHRLVAAGIPCPKPYLVKNHVLIMEFCGNDGWPSPRLKDAAAVIEEGHDSWDRLYLVMVRLMRRMYHVCKLVHADLSEYNLLYHAGEIVVIDVSQSVEHDHPHALGFLRSDCDNITSFFGKCGVRNPLTTRQLFDFVTDINVGEEEAFKWIDDVLAASILEEPAPISAEEEVDAAVFRQAHIPRTLNDVQFFEQHAQRALKGDTANVFYQTLTGMAEDLTGAAGVGDEDGDVEARREEEEDAVLEVEVEVEAQAQAQVEARESGSDTTSDSESDEGDSDGDGEGEGDGAGDVDMSKGGTFLKRPDGEVIDLTKLPRDERKKVVKEARREKRKDKKPKAVKKAQKKKASRGKKR